MSDYQFNGWNCGDLVGVGALLADPSDVLGTAGVATIALRDGAEGFAVSVNAGGAQDDMAANAAEQSVTLGAPLTIAGIVYPIGSQIVPEIVLKTGGMSPVTLVSGRIFAGTDIMRKSEPIVFTSARLAPEEKIQIISAKRSTATAPVQNCFARGTLIDTPHGALPIEDLDAGDEVVTRNGSVQLISWLGQKRLCGLELVLNPSLRPVRIMAGALTGGRPGQDLSVAQNHRLLVDDWRAPYLFGEEEILVPARSLLNKTNVFIDCPLGGVDYFHLLMDGHKMVCANGLWAETMLPDPATIGMLSDAQQAAVRNLIADGSDPQENIRAVLPALPYQSAASVAA